MTSDGRRHFAAIAEAMAGEADRRRREALGQSAAERMRAGLRLAQPFVGRSPAIDAEAERRVLEQADLHARWRALMRRR